MPQPARTTAGVGLGQVARAPGRQSRAKDQVVVQTRQMMHLSPPTVGCAAELARNAFSEGELEILFVRVGLHEFMPKSWYGKAKLVGPTVRAALRAAAGEDRAASDGLVELVRIVAERLAPRGSDQVEVSDLYQRLREAVRADGYDLRLVGAQEQGATGGVNAHNVVQILPLDEPAAPLSATVTALEADFDRLGLGVAISVYRQAVDSLTDQRFEAANGQIRAMFEEVVVHAAASVGFKRSKQGDGGRAIRHLIDTGALPTADGGHFIEGLWSITHTNGPHPGTSSAGEARFRLQAMTAAARYLIDRFFAP